jgi:predicted enzyme related to lactoylglutathione lyase
MMVKPEAVPMCALNTYFGVDDIEVTLAKASAAGATLMAPKTEIQGIGYWAMFVDPDGIPIGIFQGGLPG